MSFVRRHGKKHKPITLKTADGDRLFKRCEIKVIIGDKTYQHKFVAPAKRAYSASDIEDQLEKVINHLDEKFPLLDFKQVQIAPNAFNFIAIGPRQAEAPVPVEKNDDHQPIPG